MSALEHPILVIEDDPDLLLMLATVLELDGHRVLTAANGIAGYHLAQRYRPSLIVLDLMLPIMSGEDFRRVQLADAALKDVPVVVVSARHDARAVAERIGAVGWLTKPLDLETFSALVRSVVPSGTRADHNA